MDRVCPFLRLAGDPHAAIDGVEPAHRCQASDPPTEIDRSTQARLCLSVDHAKCERFLARRARDQVDAPGHLEVGGGYVSTRLLLAPQPAWRGLAGRGRRQRRAFVLGAGVVILAIALGSAGLASGALGWRDVSPVPSPTAIRIVTPTASPSPSPLLAPTPSPSASPTPTVRPTASPRPSPTPAPPKPSATSSSRTYTVVAGDTLALIAQRFGTTVAALQAANDIDDPDTISVGQVLSIP